MKAVGSWALGWGVSTGVPSISTSLPVREQLGARGWEN